MKNKIKTVKPGSIAEEMGIEKGDCLLSINGVEIKDIIDYKFLISDEYVKIEIEKEKYATFNAAYFFGSSEEISNPQSS